MKKLFWIIYLYFAVANFLACGSEVPATECQAHDHIMCQEGVVYWVDSCDQQGDRIKDCECGCDEFAKDCRGNCDCTPDCDGRECGDDGCGAPCAPGCAADQSCDPDSGTCQQICNPACVDACCGDDNCGGTCPDTCAATGKFCDSDSCQCVDDCVLQCDGKCCGDDGCGGTCPDTCAATGKFCVPNTCQCADDCVLQCDGKCCGDDGCGGTCPDTCAATGQTCDLGSCACQGDCTPDCTDKQCGSDGCDDNCGLCSDGFFCPLDDFSCIETGVTDCFDQSQCPADSPYCIVICQQHLTRCCTVAPSHPRTVDGQIDDSCETCCPKAEFPHPVLWPDGESACCSDGAPYPYFSCQNQDKLCCPDLPASPSLCDGSVDTGCMQCCGGDYPHPVRFPDGSASCCPASHPFPCVTDGNNGCCEEAGKCG